MMRPLPPIVPSGLGPYIGIFCSKLHSNWKWRFISKRIFRYGSGLKVPTRKLYSTGYIKAMEDHPLYGKRKKKKEVIANPLFVGWLTEWKEEAAEKGWKSQYTYGKVQ